MITTKKKVRLYSLILSLVMLVGVLASTVSVSATSNNPYNSLADRVSQFYTEGNVQAHPERGQEPTYEMEGGGYLSYSELFERSESGGSADLSEAKFKTLTKTGQKEAVNDIANASLAVKEDSQTSDSGAGIITDETVESWWTNLQKKDGVGSKFLNSALADTKPDFVTARKWYKPFQGPISSFLGFASIAAIILCTGVIALDILYIVVPPVRAFVDDSGAEDKIKTSHIFSHAAIRAVKTVEEGGDNGKKATLGIYFKSRVWELVLLGICLLYLVNGQIFSIIGYILDLLSGFTG